MNAVVDVGNSFSKIGFFENDSLKRKETFGSSQELKNFLLTLTAENVLLSSVALDPVQVATWVKARGRKIILSPALPLPIQNRYATPATLGVDRIAAACGAKFLFPLEDCLVIDIGTCINYEFVNKAGHYWGGAISPGVRMRFESMHRFTAKLPQVQPVEAAPLVGKSTEQCLQSGVMNGVLEEIKGGIFRYENLYPGLRVILCGGDRHFFENHLKPSIFVAPELVLMGLNSILLHNVAR